MLQLKNVNKKYNTKGGVVVNALDNVSMYFEDKGMVFVLGKSGSGKSTLLNVIGGLDRYDSGEIVIKDRSSSTFKGSDFDSYRNTFIGFIFQEYNILEEFSVKKNIGLALELQGKNADDNTINKILNEVDMQGLGDRKPNTLSGGQKQRVAIARALVKNPEIIMADEPTGALDSNTGKQVFDTLKKLSKEKLVIIVSHDRDFAEKYADRIIELADGKVISDVKKTEETGKKLEEDVTLISDSILAIKKGKKLEVKDLDVINKFLENQKEDIFITANKKINTDIKTAANVEGGDNFSFKNTKDNELNKKKYYKEDFKLIRSKLPFKHSFKIGASGLKVKPVRLIFTILLASIAFAFFGLSDTISQFNRVNTAVDVLQNENVTFAAITKQKTYYYGDYSYDENEYISQSEIDELNLKFPDADFKAVNTNYNISLTEYVNQNNSLSLQSYYSQNTTGTVCFTPSEFENGTFKILYGTYPDSENKIAITKYIAETFVSYGYKDNLGNVTNISAINEMVGKTLGLSGLTISGIIDTGTINSKYDVLKTENTDMMNRNYYLENEFYQYRNYSYHNLLFVNPDFSDTNVSEALKDYTFMTGISLYDGNNNYYYTSYMKVADLTDISNYIFIDESKTSLEKGEIIIPLHYIANFLDFTQFIDKQVELGFVYDSTEYNGILFNNFLQSIQSYIYGEKFEDDEYNSSNNIELFYKFINDNKTLIMSRLDEITIIYSLQSNDYRMDVQEIQEVSGEYTVAGFSNITYLDSNGNCVLDLMQSDFDILKTDNENLYPYALGFLPQNNSDLYNFIKESYTTKTVDGNVVRFGLNNYQISMLDSFYEMIRMMAKIFFYIGLGFAIFSALLMLNFISTSISYKKREIGILRAIGARSNDVFGIFFNESLLIASINTLVAIIFSVLACYFLNDTMKTELNYNANFLFFGIRQIILIFGISVFSAFIASFLPVKKIASKKPIDAIRGR
jgi:ABC-type lipoprotein export system ATPase subunit/ABC-type antimicrobial peptide transport system permease subunit